MKFAEQLKMEGGPLMPDEIVFPSEGGVAFVTFEWLCVKLGIYHVNLG